MIKNILFDMGNVLIRFEPKRYVKNAGLSESDQQLLLRELYGSIDWVRLDRGGLFHPGAGPAPCRISGLW